MLLQQLLPTFLDVNGGKADASPPCTPLQAGCDDGQGPLPYQGCRLLAAANCTLPLEVTARLQGAQAATAGAREEGPATRAPWRMESAPCALLAAAALTHARGPALQRLQPTPPPSRSRLPTGPARCASPPPTRHPCAGFPVRAALPTDYPGFVTRPGQEIVGEDFQCAGSLADSVCALPTASAAAMMCGATPACVSVVWYPNGTDGCSAEVAVAKRSHPSATNTRMTPNVVVLDGLEAVMLVRRAAGPAPRCGRGVSAAGAAAAGLEALPWLRRTLALV